VVVFARFAFYAKQNNRLQERQNNTLLPPFSLIICARNEADNIRRFLPAVLAQEYVSDWELLLVDDASTDETALVLRAFQAEYPRLNVVQINGKTFPGKKHALEQGIKACKYSNILLTDADCQPASPFWLSGMAETAFQHSETELVLGYGPMYEVPGMLNRWARFETAHTAMQYFSFSLAGMPYMGVGRNLAFTKPAFERTGGFTTHHHIPSGDDDLLVNAVARPDNTAICIAPEAFVFSAAKTTWRQWLRQKRRHLGASSGYRPIHQFLLASLSISQVFHYFFLLILLLSGYHLPALFVAYGLRMLVLHIIYAGVFSKLRCKDLLRYVFILDVLQTIYFGIFVPFYLIFRHKSVEWK
jgi:glycosyltransferase involved in cell wall biosynthesis